MKLRQAVPILAALAAPLEGCDLNPSYRAAPSPLDPAAQQFRARANLFVEVDCAKSRFAEDEVVSAGKTPGVCFQYSQGPKHAEVVLWSVNQPSFQDGIATGVTWHAEIDGTCANASGTVQALILQDLPHVVCEELAQNVGFKEFDDCLPDHDMSR